MPVNWIPSALKWGGRAQQPLTGNPAGWLPLPAVHFSLSRGPSPGPGCFTQLPGLTLPVMTHGDKRLLSWQAPQAGLPLHFVPGCRLLCFTLNHPALMAVPPRLQRAVGALMLQRAPPGGPQAWAPFPTPPSQGPQGALESPRGGSHTHQIPGGDMLGSLRRTVAWALELDIPGRDNPTSVTYQLCNLQQETDSQRLCFCSCKTEPMIVLTS